MAAKVGAVSRVAINTASAQQNVETPIDFSLFDADGIDVTPSINLDATCTVSVSGDYSTASIDKPSKATITMTEIGKEAEVTVAYNSNAAGAQDVTATQKVTCIDAVATTGSKLFATAKLADKKVNRFATVDTDDDCAKFYLGLSDATVKVAEDGTNSDVYFCAKDSKGDVISYESYEVESSNDDVASATATVTTGKFAKITVVGNKVGAAQVNVKATKNGKDTYYTIPVSVTPVLEAASMEVKINKSTMSNVADKDYKATIEAQLYDKEKNKIPGNFDFEVITTVSGTGISFDYVNKDDISESASNANPGKAYVYANEALAKTYTIKVVGSDVNTGKTIERKVNVVVKNLDTSAPLNLTYQVELSRKTIDENPMDTTDDSVTARLYATYNGLFAGYVRKNANGYCVADPSANVEPKNDIHKIEAGAKFGTKVYSPNQDVFGTSGAAIGFAEIQEDGETYDAVKSGDVTYNVTDKTSDQLAKVGTYTIEYRIYDNANDEDKYTSKTNTVTVSNSVYVPTIAVTSRTVDSLSDADIIKVLKASVDMNNNTSDYASIVENSLTVASESTTRKTIKSANVKDDYNTTTWTFVVPVNATFKTE